MLFASPSGEVFYRCDLKYSDRFQYLIYNVKVRGIMAMR